MLEQVNFDQETDKVDEGDISGEMADLITLVERHWTINEDMSDELQSSHMEDEMARLMEESFTQDKEGRITLPCLWRPGGQRVRSNFDYARIRLRSLLG